LKERHIKSWAEIEDRLRAALTDFARSAESTYQGSLFAQDALAGLRIIDLTRERFDAVVMNPPFGVLPSSMKEILTKRYPDSKADLLSIFVERGAFLLKSAGR